MLNEFGHGVQHFSTRASHQKLLSIVSMVMYCRKMRKSKVINHSLLQQRALWRFIFEEKVEGQRDSETGRRGKEISTELKKGFHETETATEKNLRDAVSSVGKNSLNINWRRILRL